MITVPAHIPTDDVPVPASVATWAGGRDLTPVWRNDLGGLTFRVAGGGYVKWAPAGSGLPLEREAARLAWAARWAVVPRVLAHGTADDGYWLATAALPGDTAVAARWRTDPRPAVEAIGHGLRRLHDALPVDACPWSWRAEDRLAVARRLPGRAPADLSRAAGIPPVDRLVVCHGDACAPNTLIGPGGGFAGHVDLGSLGVGDRWSDLAVATWSCEWNYGPGWEPVLLAAYGVDPDPVRTAYYRLLWDLGP